MNPKITHHTKTILLLTTLLIAIDLILVYLYPTVNFIRATIVAVIAYLFLAHSYFSTITKLPGHMAFLPITFSAFMSVFLIGRGILVSRTMTSAFIHVLILIAVYLTIIALYKGEKK